MSDAASETTTARSRPSARAARRVVFKDHEVRQRQWPSGPAQARAPGLVVYEAGLDRG